MNEILAKLASMSDIWEKLIILLLGWLLGLLGPAIVDGIRRKRENKLGRTAILSELHDVGGILATAVYTVKTKEGSIDREHLQWLKAYIEKGKRSEPYPGWVGRLETFLSWSDEEIARNFGAMMVGEGKGTMLQKYPVPLLDSRVTALWSFDNAFQRSLLEIRQRLHRLDDMVDRQRKLHDMTFSNIEGANREALNENIRETCSFYAESARKVVDLIAKITVDKKNALD
jgi:hypothetical protein